MGAQWEWRYIGEAIPGLFICLVWMTWRGEDENTRRWKKGDERNETDASESGRGEQFRGKLRKCTFLQQILLFLVINRLRLGVPLLVFHFNLVKSLLIFGFGRVCMLNLSDRSSNLALRFHVCISLFTDSISYKMRNFHVNGCNGPFIHAIARQQNKNIVLLLSCYVKNWTFGDSLLSKII